MTKMALVGLTLGAIACSSTDSASRLSEAVGPADAAPSPAPDASLPMSTSTTAIVGDAAVTTVAISPCNDTGCFSSDLGAYDSSLCLLTSLSGPMRGYDADYRYAYQDTPPYLVDWQGGLDTSVSLFIDEDTNVWHLDATSENQAAVLAEEQASLQSFLRALDGMTPPPPNGTTSAAQFSARVSCIPWSTFSLTTAPVASRVLVGAQNGPATMPLPRSGACFLSELSDDYADGAADLRSGSLVLTSTDGGYTSLWAAATCFAGLTAIDVPLTNGAPLPRGLCGLSAVSGMNSANSLVDVSGPVAHVASASASARCLLY